MHLNLIPTVRVIMPDYIIIKNRLLPSACLSGRKFAPQSEGLNQKQFITRTLRMKHVAFSLDAYSTVARNLEQR